MAVTLWGPWQSWRSLPSLSWLCSNSIGYKSVMSSVFRDENRVHSSFKSEIYNPFLRLYARRKNLLSVFTGFETDCCYPLSTQHLSGLLWLAVLAYEHSSYSDACNVIAIFLPSWWLLIPLFSGNPSWNGNISKYLYSFLFFFLNSQ